MDLIQFEIDKEEEKDRLSTGTFEGKTISEILDDGELQRELQKKGVHIGYTFPVTISKVDVEDFRNGKRSELKKIYFLDNRDER